MSYEVPDGWANGHEWITEYSIVPLAARDRLAEDAGATTDEVRLLARPVAATITDRAACVPARAEDVEASIDALAEWVVNRPGIDASTPTEIEVGGHRGLVIDVDMAPGTGPPCEVDQVPGVPLFVGATGFGQDCSWKEDWVRGTWGYVLEGTSLRGHIDPVRLNLLDLDGDPLLIVIDSAPPWVERADGGASLSAQDYRRRRRAFAEEAMPIVESFRFPT